MDPRVDRRPAGVDARPSAARAARAAPSSPLSVSLIVTSRTRHAICGKRDASARGRRPIGAANVRGDGIGRCDGQDGLASRAARRVRAREAFAELPSRYLGAAARLRRHLPDPARRRRPHLGGARLRGERCEVRPSPAREPDVVIGTDAATWLALREGRLSGLDAFAQRRLYARGDLDLRARLRGPVPAPGRPRRRCCGSTDVETLGAAGSTTLIAGDGPEHVDLPPRARLEQGLVLRDDRGALARVHGPRARPARLRLAPTSPPAAPTTRPGSPTAVRGYLDAMGIDRAHLIGNSMGGRVALEVALRGARAGRLAEPARPGARLSPPPSSRRWCRLLRPELAVIPHPLRERDRRATSSGACSRSPERLDPAAADVAVDEFCRLYRSRAARVAFFAAARNIYLDEPHGERGFWTRLARLEPPALFVWGDRDRLVPPASPPRRRGAARRRAGDPRRLRPRAPGRARRAHQRADPRAIDSATRGGAAAAPRRAASRRRAPAQARVRYDRPMADPTTLGEQAKRNGGATRTAAAASATGARAARRARAPATASAARAAGCSAPAAGCRRGRSARAARSAQRR